MIKQNRTHGTPRRSSAISNLTRNTVATPFQPFRRCPGPGDFRRRGACATQRLAEELLLRRPRVDLRCLTFCKLNTGLGRCSQYGIFFNPSCGGPIVKKCMADEIMPVSTGPRAQGWARKGPRAVVDTSGRTLAWVFDGLGLVSAPLRGCGISLRTLRPKPKAFGPRPGPLGF